MILLDSDAMGRKMAGELKTSLYQGNEARILDVGSFSDCPDAEIEDLFPATFMASVVDRWQRTPDPENEFGAAVDAAKPLVPQIEMWAVKHSIRLDKGWKVELAKRVKQLALVRGIAVFDADTQGRWVKLFDSLAA